MILDKDTPAHNTPDINTVIPLNSEISSISGNPRGISANFKKGIIYLSDQSGNIFEFSR
jgi:hypothetical protein